MSHGSFLDYKFLLLQGYVNAVKVDIYVFLALCVVLMYTYKTNKDV